MERSAAKLAALAVLDRLQVTGHLQGAADDRATLKALGTRVVGLLAALYGSMVRLVRFELTTSSFGG
jgi:hypothetical protein